LVLLSQGENDGAVLEKSEKSPSNIFRKVLGFQVDSIIIVKKISIFWDIMPCGPLKVSRRFGGTDTLHLKRRRIGQARDRQQADLSVEFQRTTRRYIPEGRTLRSPALRV
jgi:hypothetical protein